MNIDLGLFKIVQFSIALLFGIFISDFRRKKGMKPLLNETYTKLVKLTYPLIFAIYLYTLYNLEQIYSLDILAFTFSLLGTFTVIKAKRDLADSHTWAGYHMKKSTLIIHGIYAYMRNPLYTGIFIFIFGALITIIQHTTVPTMLVTLALLGFVSSFLINSSREEAKSLERTFGKTYTLYRKQVHAFLPLKKYKK